LQVSFRKRDNQYTALFEHLRETSDGLGIVLRYVAVCCSELQCVQRVAVRCNTNATHLCETSDGIGIDGLDDVAAMNSRSGLGASNSQKSVRY